MATINKKDASPYWYASYHDAAGTQHSKSTGVLREDPDPVLAKANAEKAKQIAADYERRAHVGLPVSGPAPAPPPVPGIPTYKKFFSDWMSPMVGDKDYHDKVNSYGSNIAEYLGTKVDWQVCKFGWGDFAGLPPFLLEKGYSPCTVNAHLKLLRQVFSAAVTQGFALNCPISRANYVDDGKPLRPTALTVPQVEWIANSTKIIDWQTAFLFAFYCAMELLEAVSQLWDNVGFDKKCIKWKTFTRRGNVITTELPLHPVLERRLLALKQVSHSPYITPTLQELNDCTLRVRFQKIVEDSKIPAPTIPTKRHGDFHTVQFASIKLAFAKAMGHEDSLGLTKFLRALTREELASQIASLPHLQLVTILLSEE